MRVINRRRFLAASLVAPAVFGQSGSNQWGTPVLDVHLHTRKDPASALAHIDGSGVTKAVLLTRASDEELAHATMSRYPGRFTWFVSSDVTNPGAIAAMRLGASHGALGFGELKDPVPLDSPEMKSVYSLAAELGRPVLMHFQELNGDYNTGFTRFPAILKAFPKTTFIGHGNFFWANISADEPSGVTYPNTKVKPGGLTDRMLSDFPNLYGDLSANSGRNSLVRDPDFSRGFLERHRSKLLFGCDCPCLDGQGTQPSVAGKPSAKTVCVARETLTALKQLASPDVMHQIAWTNGTQLLHLTAL